MTRDKRRRLDRLGAGKPDPEVSAMTDEELLAAYFTDPNAPPEPRPSGSPFQQRLQSLSDDELLAFYDEVRAELDAAEAEAERRRPKPKPVILPVQVTAPPDEPHPVMVSEPKPPAPKLTPRQEFDARQAAMMREAVAEELVVGESVARHAHEAGRARSETMGPSDLLDALGHDNRNGG